MKNYYQSVEESVWPKRHIDKIQEIPNTFDHLGIAVRVTLVCGHSCVLTGIAVYNRTEIHCKPCGETHNNSN